MTNIKLIKYEDWSLLEKQDRLPFMVPDKIIVHHYGCFSNSRFRHMENYNGIDSIRNLQSSDIRRLGAIDIRYHFIIAPDGLVYECRAINKQAFHCKRNNHKSISIMFYGNFNIEHPKNEMVSAFLNLLCYIKRIYPHLDIQKSLFTHSDFELTLCCGHHISNMISIIKKRKGVSYVRDNI